MVPRCRQLLLVFHRENKSRTEKLWNLTTAAGAGRLTVWMAFVILGECFRHQGPI